MLSKKQILDAERAGGVVSWPTMNIQQISAAELPEELKSAMIALKVAQRRIAQILVQYEVDVREGRD